jgi:hypothetical protein
MTLTGPACISFEEKNVTNIIFGVFSMFLAYIIGLAALKNPRRLQGCTLKSSKQVSSLHQDDPTAIWSAINGIFPQNPNFDVFCMFFVGLPGNPHNTHTRGLNSIPVTGTGMSPSPLTCTNQSVPPYLLWYLQKWSRNE